MNRKISSCAVHVFPLLMLLAAGASLAQDPEPECVHLKGLLNDYTPSTVKGGPWEMHGQWILDLHPRRGVADFTADMTMADYVSSDSTPLVLIAGQNSHTHDIKLTNATITWNMDGCPPYLPATLQGFQINGTVTLLTGNGSNAPFETSPPSSTLQVCVTGGAEASYSEPNSNITLVFGGPAVTHFGTLPIHGVVKK